jgi:hypothetical protein
MRETKGANRGSETDHRSGNHHRSYAMTYIKTGQITRGLVFAVIEPFGESLLSIGVISLLQIKLLLIADLDNPFAAG